jgi:hypothetical protein
VIVVVGDLRADARPPSAASIAAQLAGRRSAVEIVGLVPGDPSGDRQLLELAKRGVGHAAVLRSPGEALEAADLELALRYLPGIGTIVLVDDGRGELLATAAAAAAWGASGLIVVVAGGPATANLPGRAIVLQSPASDPDGTFAGFVAALATRLEAGEESPDALRSTIAALAVDAVGGEPG